MKDNFRGGDVKRLARGAAPVLPPAAADQVLPQDLEGPRLVQSSPVGVLVDAVTTRDYSPTMRVVGIKQLKARLSEYLRAVRQGEVFLVTDRDQVVAELRPPRSPAPPPADDLEEAFELLLEGGEVQAPRLTKGDWTWRPAGAGLPAGTAGRLLDELREERGDPAA
jgi:antitoxin (DNA-binding transcriptional repressor) of toxin-antitoxin stability system